MWYAPVRIRRETMKVDISKIHWVETVQYSFLFGAEKDFLSTNNKNDIRNFLENAIKKYEMETCQLRKKAFEVEPEGQFRYITNIRSIKSIFRQFTVRHSNHGQSNM